MWTCPADLKPLPLGSKKDPALRSRQPRKAGEEEGLGVLKRVREGCTELCGMSSQDKNEAFE